MLMSFISARQLPIFGLQEIGGTMKLLLTDFKSLDCKMLPKVTDNCNVNHLMRGWENVGYLKVYTMSKLIKFIAKHKSARSSFC